MLRQLFLFIVSLIRRLLKLFGFAPRPAPIPVNTRPSVQILSPTSSVQADDLPIRYRLSDQESDLCSVKVYFSVAGGMVRVATAKLSHPSHSGTGSLASAPGGIDHTFVWDWQRDLPSGGAANVTIQLLAEDAFGPGAATTTNSINISSLPLTIPGVRPSVIITGPATNVVGTEVLISFDIVDPDSDPVDITVTFSTGGPFRSALAKIGDPRHHGVSALTSSPAGEAHQFVWDWQNDIPGTDVQNVVVQVVASDGIGPGPISSTGAFAISANPVLPMPSNLPEVVIVSPDQNVDLAPSISVEFVCSDPNGYPVDATLEYSVNGGAFQVATPLLTDPAHVGTANLSAPPTGSTHVFVWHKQSDLGSGEAVGIILRMRVSNGTGQSFPAFSRLFSMTNLPTLTTPAPAQLTLTVLSRQSQFSGTVLLLDYELAEPNSEPASINVEYSLNGAAFQLATARTSDPRHSGTQMILSNPNGIPHGFVWDWIHDVASNEMRNVIIRIRATLASGMSVTSQTGPVEVTVDVHDYTWTIIDGANLEACPCMLLPVNSIKLELSDHGIKVPNAGVAVFVIEGGGGFKEARPPAGEQLRSHVQLVTDADGVVQLPQFLMGREEGPNRILIQSEHAVKMVTIMGSFANVAWKPINPASGFIEDMIAQTVTMTAQLQDANFSDASIEKIAVAIEILSGGGWLKLTDGFSRTTIKATEENWILPPLTMVKSSVQFSCLLSIREEQAKVRLTLRDYANFPPFDFTIDVKRLRLITYRIGNGLDEDLDKTSSSWLSKVSRWAVTNDQHAATGSPRVPTWVGFEILAKSTSGQSELEPENRTGWGGQSTLIMRPSTSGLVNYELFLPDVVDDPKHNLFTQGVDRLDSYLAQTTSPPLFVETHGGGSRDDNMGIELQLVGGDLQFVGPNARATHPFQFNVITRELLPVDERRFVSAKLFFKIRTAPASSRIDDPSNVNVRPGTVGLSANTGSDKVELEVFGAPAVHPVTVYFRSSDYNCENFIEVTAEVNYEWKDSNDIWRPATSRSNILARAIFFPPRLSISKKSGTDFFPVGEESLVPTPLVNESGSPLPPDPDRDYYLELRAQDYGTTVPVRIAGSGFIVLTKVENNQRYTLYRSKPITMHLESPQNFGGQFLNLPADHEYVSLTQPEYFYGDAKNAIPNNTLNANYFSAARPFTFFNMIPIFYDVLSPFVPKPLLRFTNLNQRDPAYNIVVENNKAKLQIQGEVRDTLADLTPGTVAHIAEIRINGTAFTLATESEAVSTLRPYAWKGKFDFKIELLPGIQVVDFEVENALGEKTVRFLQIELTDSRNDFVNPDAATTKAVVKLLNDVALDNRRGLCSMNYRLPSKRQTMSLPRTIPVTLRSIGKYPAIAQEDRVDALLRVTAGLEHGYHGIFLAVPPTVNTQKLQALQQAGAPIIKHTAGSRLHARSIHFPHLNGPIELQNFINSSSVLFRVLAKNDAGVFEERRVIEVGDEFTIEAHQSTAVPYSPMMLIVATCDSLGQILPGQDRLIQVELRPAPAAGWLRMTHFVDAQGSLVAGTSIILVDNHSDRGAVGAILRMQGHGSIRIGENLGEVIYQIWGVTNNPKRQSINAKQVPAPAGHRQAARGGARNTVVIATGEVYLEEIDLSLHGRGAHAEWKRNYASFNDYEGPLGPGWNHNYNRWLQKINNDMYVYVNGLGQRFEFTRQPGSNDFFPERGLFGQLILQRGNVARIRWTGGTEEIFVKQNELHDIFLLEAVQDRCRNRVDCIRDQSGLLAHICDAISQRILLQYDEKERIKAVGDLTGRRWSYKYHGSGSSLGPEGSFMSVTTPPVTAPHNSFPLGREKQYDYYNTPTVKSSHTKLKAIQDPEGSLSRTGGGTGLPALIAMTYNGDGRVEKQTFGNGDFVFDYGINETAVTNRRNYKTLYKFPSPSNHMHLITLPLEIHKPAYGGAEVTKFDYNDDGLTTRMETPLGTVMEYRYQDSSQDPREWPNRTNIIKYAAPGLSRDVIDTVAVSNFANNPARSQPAQLEWVYTYESLYQQIKTITDPLGQLTANTYDYETADAGTSDGNLYKTEESHLTTGVHQQGRSAREKIWKYNNYGQPIKHINALGVVTEFEYYPKDNPQGGLGAPVSAAGNPTGWLAKVIVDSNDPSVTRSTLLDPVHTFMNKFSYDAWGNIKEETTLNGHIVSSAYNEMGELIERRWPGGLIQQFWYDVNQHQVKRSDLISDVNFPDGATHNSRGVVYHESEYNRRGFIVKEIADSTGLMLTTAYEYDDEDNVQKRSTPNANRGSNPNLDSYIEFAYDPQDRLETQKAAPGSGGWERSFYYDEDSRLHILSEAAGYVSSGARETQYFYDAWGNQVAEVDAYGNTQRKLYDSLGRPTYNAVEGSVDGDTQHLTIKTLAESFTFLNEAGLPVAYHNRVFKWKQQGTTWVQESIDSGKQNMTYEYDGDLSVAMVNVNGLRTERRFDGRGNLTTSQNVIAGKTEYHYDGMGNMIEALKTSPTGSLVTTVIRTYNESNQVTSSDGAGKGPMQFGYDTMGNLRILQDALGNRTYHEYDAVGRKIKTRREIRAGGRLRAPGSTRENPIESEQLVQFDYDENGNVLEVKDQLNRRIIKHLYGSWDERLTTVLADDSFPQLNRASSAGTGPNAQNLVTFEYWEDGKLKFMTTPDNIRIYHNYNASGLLIERSVAAAPGVSPPPAIFGTTQQTFKYDGLRRCVFATDDNGVAGSSINVVQQYDSLSNVWEDRQIQTILSDHQDIAITGLHRDNGELAVIQHPGSNNAAIRYVYNTGGDLSEIYDNSTNDLLVSFEYEHSYLKSMTMSNNHVTRIDHNHEGVLERSLYLSTVAGTTPVGTVPGLLPNQKAVIAEEYSLEDRGFPDVIKDLKRSKADLNQYDSLGHLRVTKSEVDANNLDAKPKYGAWHSYDSHGNTTSREEGPLKNRKSANNEWLLINPIAMLYTFNSANQLGRSTEMYVDDRGNLQQDSHDIYYDRRGNMTADHKYDYRYDAFNRLIAIYHKGTQNQVMECHYDAYDRRILKTGVRFVYYRNKLVEQRPFSNFYVRRFFHGPNGVVMMENDGRAVGNSRYRLHVHTDRSGTAKFLTNPLGSVVEVYGHNPLTGETTLFDANGTILGLPIGNPFLYQGMYYDYETGLYCLGARFFHPKFKRMMQVDPEGPDRDWSLYNFANNNTHSYADPNGRHPVLILLYWAAAGALLGGAFAMGRQVAQRIDGTRDEFDFDEVAWGAAIGALAGPALYLAPTLSIYFAIGAGVSSVHEFSEGNIATGVFDLIGAGLATYATTASVGKLIPSKPKSPADFAEQTAAIIARRRAHPRAGLILARLNKLKQYETYRRNAGGQLPPFVRGKTPTRGNFEAEGNEIGLQSRGGGAGGGAADTVTQVAHLSAEARTILARADVEAQAAVIMAREGITEANLVINHPDGPCSNCLVGVRELLPPGAWLRVGSPSTYGGFHGGVGYISVTPK
jgi:RHS repeat-associated protein